MDAYRAYFARFATTKTPNSSMPAWIHPAGRPAGALQRRSLRHAAGLEPGVTAARVAAPDSMLATSHRLVQAFMSLEGGLIRSRPVPARVAFRPFAEDVT